MKFFLLVVSLLFVLNAAKAQTSEGSGAMATEAAPVVTTTSGGDAAAPALVIALTLAVITGALLR